MSGVEGSTRLVMLKLCTWAVPVGLVSQALTSLVTPQWKSVTSIQPSLRADVPEMPSILMMQRNAMTYLCAGARLAVDDPEGRPGTPRRLRVVAPGTALAEARQRPTRFRR